jgi:hypothetical protein
MENNQPAANPVAEQVVEQNINETNTNGIPGSLPGETRAETQARLYRVMVDGQELEVDENELKRGYAHNRAAAKRMEEAAMTRKEAETVLKMFQENPREAFKLLGKDARKFAEEIINEELREAMLTPEQRELRDYKRELERYQQAEKQAREAYEREQQEAEMNRYTEQVQQQIIDTLTTAGLPKTERTIGRIAYYMQAALQAGFSDVKPVDVIDHVKKDYQYDLKSLLGGLSEEQLETFLEADIVRKIARSTVKKAPAPKPVPREVNQRREERSEKKYKSPRDFFNQGY